MSEEEYAVTVGLQVKNMVLPSMKCGLTLIPADSSGEGALAFKKRTIIVPYKNIKPFAIPRMSSAKKVVLDLEGHEKYVQLSLIFEKPEQLRRVCELLSQHIKLCAPKKLAASQVTRQLVAPSRAQSIKPNIRSVPATQVSSPLSSVYKSTLQSCNSPRSVLMSTFGQDDPTYKLKDVKDRFKPGRYENKPKENYRQNSDNVNTRKRPINPMIVDSENVSERSGEVELVERKGIETKKARNEEREAIVEEEIPISNYLSRNKTNDDAEMDQENNPRVSSSRTSPTTPLKPTVTSHYKSTSSSSLCWPRKRFSASFSYRSMVNLGNSCYMNASLQALASLPLFITELFKNVPTINNRTALLKSVVDVYRHIFSPPPLLDRVKRKEKSLYQGETDWVPRKFLEKVREAAGNQIDEEMATRSQQDAQEFVGRLLDIIHDEIEEKSPVPTKRRSPIPQKHGSPSSDKENQAIVDKEAREQSPETRQRKNKSMEVRSALMPWKNSILKLRGKPVPRTNPGKLFKVDCYNRLLCNSCGYTERKEESAYEVQLGLHDGKHTISALLEAQFELHNVDWKCPKCTNSVTTASTSFHNVPEYLFIVLKRYGYDQYGGTKSSNRISIDPHLYLEDLCENSKKKEAELEPKKIYPSQSDEQFEIQDYVVPETRENSPMKTFMNTPEKPPKGFFSSSPMKCAQRPPDPSQELQPVPLPSQENKEAPSPTESQGTVDLFSEGPEDNPASEGHEELMADVKEVFHGDVGSLEDSTDKPSAQLSDNEEIVNVENPAEAPPTPSKEFHRTEGPCYTLSAIVNHMGASLSHGHYTAYSFDLDRKVWLKCDDSSITKATLDNVLDYSKSTCYLLMYRRRHPGDEDQF